MQPRRVGPHLCDVCGTIARPVPIVPHSADGPAKTAGTAFWGLGERQHGCATGTDAARRHRRRHRQRARMVRLCGLRLCGGLHREELLSAGRSRHRPAGDLPDLRARLPGAPARRHHSRPRRRHPRPQDRTADHHRADGGRHRDDRHPADLRVDRRRGATAAADRTPAARLLGRRRMGLVHRLYRRMGTAGPTRLLRQLPADQRRDGPAAWLRHRGAVRHAS